MNLLCTRRAEAELTASAEFTAVVADSDPDEPWRTVFQARNFTPEVEDDFHVEPCGKGAQLNIVVGHGHSGLLKVGKVEVRPMSLIPFSKTWSEPTNKKSATYKKKDNRLQANCFPFIRADLSPDRAELAPRLWGCWAVKGPFPSRLS